MKRIAFIWLPLWPIERLRRHKIMNGQASDMPDDEPLALVETSSHGLCITAVNATAAREGVRIGATLADARAALPALLSLPAEPVRDRKALLKLARWAGRYGPRRNIDGARGLWIDTTGVAHLFGGEPQLVQDLCGRLQRMGLTARAGLADTLAAARALACFAAPAEPPPWSIAAPGTTPAALAPLPVAALDLEPETVLLLKRLGLKRIGQLYELPRPALELRFRSAAASRSRRAAAETLASAVLERLDAALGTSEDPRRALGEPPLLTVRRSFAEPLLSPEGLSAQAGLMLGSLVGELARRDLGCRRLHMTLQRTDGTRAEVAIGLSAASRDASHMMSLLQERLQHVDAGFGIDALAIEAKFIERLAGRQDVLAAGLAGGRGGETGGSGEAAAQLLDRLAGRLGPAGIVRLVPHESHIPERAEQRLRGLRLAAYTPPWPYARRPLRPPFLLEAPEPIAVMAAVPEGPPASFIWRRVTHRVWRAEGPERIAPEWWRLIGIGQHADQARDAGAERTQKQPRTPQAQADAVTGLQPVEPAAEVPEARPRDYFRIEDEAGGLYWVFREGLYQRAGMDGPPRWFMHGLFG